VVRTRGVAGLRPVANAFGCVGVADVTAGHRLVRGGGQLTQAYTSPVPVLRTGCGHHRPNAQLVAVVVRVHIHHAMATARINIASCRTRSQNTIIADIRPTGRRSLACWPWVPCHPCPPTTLVIACLPHLNAEDLPVPRRAQSAGLEPCRLPCSRHALQRCRPSTSCKGPALACCGITDQESLPWPARRCSNSVSASSPPSSSWTGPASQLHASRSPSGPGSASA